MVVCIPRGGLTKAIPSKLPAKLELHAATCPGARLLSCSPAPSSLVGMHSNAGLAIMIGVALVGDPLSNAFTRNELLAKHLTGCVDRSNPTSARCFNSCLVSGLEVIIVGIFKCMWITTEVL